MTVKKHIAGAALAAALLAPSALAATAEYGVPRATPSDYARAQGVLPHALPSDYERAGVSAERVTGMPRALPADYGRYFASTRIEPRDGFDWIAAVIGATIALGAVLFAALGARWVRRASPLRTAPLLLLAALGTVSAGAAATAQAGPGPWGPETPNFNLEVILRDVSGGQGFGHVKFRQPNDNVRIIYLDTWVRDLEPSHDYLLQRQVDTIADGDCSDTGFLTPWLTLGEGFTETPITTDDRGTGRAALYRDLDPPGPMTGPPPGTELDIHFRVIDKVTSTVVLQSGCYQFTVSL